MLPRGKSTRGVKRKTSARWSNTAVETVGNQSPSSDDVEREASPSIEVQSQDEETQPTANKRGARFRVSLTAEQEQDLADFLQENPVLYNKGKDGWKDTGGKDALWRQQAEKMGLPTDYIKRWYRDIRTRFSRLIRKKWTRR